MSICLTILVSTLFKTTGTTTIETRQVFFSVMRPEVQKIFRDVDSWSLLCGSVPRVNSSFVTSFSKWKTTRSLQDFHHLIEHKKDYLRVCLLKNYVCRATDRQTPGFYSASLFFFIQFQSIAITFNVRPTEYLVATGRLIDYPGTPSISLQFKWDMSHIWWTLHFRASPLELTMVEVTAFLFMNLRQARHTIIYTVYRHSSNKGTSSTCQYLVP